MTFTFSFGKGTHNGGQGSVEFPAEMEWLWRGYDAGRTGETFVQDPAEAGRPAFRVAGLNRE